MVDTPKRIKRLLREYAAAAHEEELRRALLPISEAFGRWERRELDSGELSEIIHRFHQGPARDLWARYNTPHLEMVVAFAITTACWVATRFRASYWSISLEPCGSMRKIKRRDDVGSEVVLRVVSRFST